MKSEGGGNAEDKEFGRGEAKLNVLGQLEVSFGPLDVAIFRLR